MPCYPVRLVASLSCAVLMAAVSLEVEATGNCMDFTFLLTPSGKIDRVQPITVIRDGAPVYQNASGDGKAWLGRRPVQLTFNHKLTALEFKRNRILVKKIAASVHLGWVNRSDLLCALKPMASQTGLELKLYINTATAIQGHVKAIKAYAAPNALTCPSGGCRELSRFTGYFVFDEQDGKYLLSEEYNFKETSPLVGWVRKKDGFIWETGYGLRPRELLQKTKKGEEGFVCAYLSINDAKKNHGCRPILGGNRWFTLNDRIPILDRVNGYYKVVFPVAGVSVSDDPGKMGAARIRLSSSSQGIDTIANMKKVDVFFLIDGTQSVAPYLKAVQKVVNEIVDTLSTNENYRETEFRFGFRMYTDTYGGQSGIGNGLPLSSVCESTNRSQLKEMQANFNRQISAIAIANNTGDDYEENLYGGILKAVNDFSPCPDYTKLLFVIGDHGYSPQKQRSRGIKPISTGRIITALKGNRQQAVKRVATFFIQTPDAQLKAKSRAAYNRAYLTYRRQGQSIVRGILGPSSNEFTKYLLTTNDRQLSGKVLEGVKKFARGDVINELVLDLRGGASLVEAVSRLQGSSAFGNLPSIFWDIVKDGSCKHLGNQCENKIFDTIFQGYIPISNEVKEDLWIEQEKLRRWERILGKIADVGNLSERKQRQVFVVGFTESLRQVIKGFYKTDQRYDEFLERVGGVPVRKDSPLFQYSYKMLMDKNIVPDCEIRQLISWVHNSREMMKILILGTHHPKYLVENGPSCRRSDGSLVRIPFFEDIKSVRYGDSDKYRIDHRLYKARIYWVPTEYLP